MTEQNTIKQHSNYMDQLPPILRKKDLLQILRIGQSTLYYWIKQGRLPKPLKIGHISYWKKHDIELILEGL